MSLLLAALLITNPAAPTTSTEPAPVVAEAQKEERKICRREISSVGLHRSKRVCLTAAEWRIRDGKGNAEGMAEAGTRGN